jgi:hypothetical protein
MTNENNNASTPVDRLVATGMTEQEARFLLMTGCTKHALDSLIADPERGRNNPADVQMIAISMLSDTQEEMGMYAGHPDVIENARQRINRVKYLLDWVKTTLRERERLTP